MLPALLCLLGRHEPVFRGWGSRKVDIQVVECLYCDKVLKMYSRAR
jgi:hypothetical protein